MLKGSKNLLPCIRSIQCQFFHIIMDSLKYKGNLSPAYKDRWGVDTRVSQIDLLAKKDSQIKRLQEQLQAERKRADDALKMLDSFRGVRKIQDGNSQGLKSEVSRRLKAEEETRQLKVENEKLRSLIIQHTHSLKLHQSEISDISKGYEEPSARY